jgi:hypothetical protein
MTKEELLKTVNALPEDFITEAYVLDLAQGKIQMDYNSDLVRRFGQKGKASDIGYFEFILEIEDDYRFDIVMT